MAALSSLLRDVYLPNMIKIRQELPGEHIPDAPAELRRLLLASPLLQKIQPGMSIAITGGSRGIANITPMLRTLVSACRERGAQPFIFPAMGSHGGCTAEGQTAILASLGVTEASCGCPIRATMDTVQIGAAESGEPVCIDRYAAQADGYIAINRIKPHTAFRGEYESGLMKMLTIGCGKQHGADTCHVNGFKYMHLLVPAFGKTIIRNTNLLFGVAILENARDETSALHILSPDEIITEEPRLLLEAKRMMGRLPFPETDVLIVDRIGKNISGEGADPNISGQQVTPYAHGGIRSQRIVALGLTEETHGSAAGFGTFDAISQRLQTQIDFGATYANAITNTLLHTVKMPIVMNNDRDTIAVALKSCYEIDHMRPRVIRIRDTAHIEELYISEALLPAAQRLDSVQVLSAPAPFAFNEEGNLW